MRPADIDRTDRRRLLASLAVTAVFYVLLFSALIGFGVLLPAGGSSPDRKGSTPISIRLAAGGGRGAAGKDSVRRGSRPTGAPAAEQPAAASQSQPAAASQSQPAAASQSQPAPISQSPSAKRDLPSGDAERRLAAVGQAANQPAGVAQGRTAAGEQGNGAEEKDAGGAAGSGTAEDGIGDAGETAGLGAFIAGTTGGTPAFISWLDQALRTKLAYPEKARNRNIEGTVTILAEVSADGKNCMASIRQSSGSSILDRAAVSFVKSLFPSPVSPRKTFSGTLRIRYILTQEGT